MTPCADTGGRDSTSTANDEYGDHGRPAPFPQPVPGAKSAARDLVTLVFGRIGASILSVVTVMLVTRVLDPQDYGVVALASVTANLIFLASSGWTGTAVYRYGREQLHSRGHMRAVTWGRAALCAPILVGAISILVLLSRTPHVIPADMTSLLPLVIAFAITAVLSDHASSLIDATGRFRTSARLIVLRQGGYAAGVAALYLLGDRGSPRAVLVAAISSWLFATVVALWITSRVGWWPPLTDRPTTRAVVVLSTPLIAFTVSQYVISSADLFILRAFSSRQEVGIYALAYQAYTILLGIVGTLPNVLTPLAVSLKAAQRQSDLRHFIGRLVPQVTLLFGLIAATVVPSTRYVAAPLLGPAFTDAYLPIDILGLSVLLFLVATMYAPILVLFERTGVVAVANILAAIVNVVGDLLTLGVWHLGALGPALSTCAGTLVLAIAYSTAAARLLGTPRLPLSVLLPLPLSVATTLVWSQAIGAAVAVALGAAVTTVLIRYQGLVAPTDFDWIARLDMAKPIRRVISRTFAMAEALSRATE